MRRFFIVCALTAAHIVASFCSVGAAKAAAMHAKTTGYSPFLLPAKIVFRVLNFPLVEAAVKSRIAWPDGALIYFFIPLNGLLWALLILWIWNHLRRTRENRKYLQQALGLNDE